MKKQNPRLFSILVIFLTISLLFLASCSKDDEKKPETQDEAVVVQEETPQKPIKLDASPELSSQKWLQMLATDPVTMELGDAKMGADKVHVVSYHPHGQTRSIDAVDEINITFSEPVAPLKKIVKDTPSLIDITPAIKGEGYWKSSTTYCYRMDEKLKLSTSYAIKFKGYKAFTGKTIDEKAWNFNTPAIKIIRTVPYNRNKWKPLDQKILVQFSVDVDPDDIEDFISIQTSKGPHKLSIEYCTEKERKTLYYWGGDKKSYKQYVIIESKTDFPMAENINVQFKAGLPPLVGNVGLLKDRILGFRTFEIFKILSVGSSFSPDQGIRIECSNPLKIEHFMEKVKFEPQVEIKKEGSWNSRVFNVHGKFKPGSTYTMTIPADLKDQFGNQLGKDETFQVKCLDYSPYLHPPFDSNFVLESYLEKSIPVNVRNIFSTNVYYKKMSQREISKRTQSYYVNVENIKLDTCTKYLWKIPIEKNRDYTLGFQLKEIGITEPGFYYIYFENTSRSWYHGNIFQLTDIAVVAKWSPSQIFLLPFNMKTGQPEPNLNFELQGMKAPLKANKEGIALYEPSLSLLGSKNLFKNTVFSTPKKSFIWGPKSEMFDMWSYQYESNLSYNNNPHYFYDHFLAFTDKHLYKAGQTVKFKGILRQIMTGEMKIPGLNYVKGTVYNSRDQKIHTFKLSKKDYTRFGTFAGEFPLPQDSPTGFYNVTLKLGLVTGEIEKKFRFSVEEYKPAKFEVKVFFDQTRLIAREDFSGRVNGRYLFGTPMINGEGNCVWTIQNTYFTPKGWDGYSFGTYESKVRKTIFTKDFKLDNDGNFQFEKDKFDFQTRNSVRLSVHGEIKDKDNNRIGSSKSIVVHRGQYYIGLKTGSYFFKQNKPGKIYLATVNPEGNLFKDSELNLKITRAEWKSFQQKDASGALRWEWKKLTEDILEEVVDLPSGRFEKDYKFKKSGYYTITLTGKDQKGNTITTSGNFYVTGSGYVSWGVNEGRIIDLVTDKKEYKPGDTIELLIKSPFETSTVLVTAEREKVVWSKLIRMKGNADTVKIPVTKDFMPNIYVNVIILKERTGLKWDEQGKDIGKPEFYSGYKSINVDASENKLNIDVKADQTSYEPGSTVNLDITVTDKEGNPVDAELCLSIVDKGVLNLVGYQLPDPYQFFWRNRPLDVKTVSTLNDVLGRRKFKEKGEDPGGDGGLSPFGSVVVRKNFKESAFYNAFVVTGKDGKSKITFTLPDNLTTFKAMAVAGTINHKFGRGNTDLLVKKKIILKPALPNFSRVADRFSAGVIVTNNTDQKMDITVEVQAQDIDRTTGDPDEKTITLKPNESGPLWFNFEVNSTKTAKLTFRAVAGEHSDGLYQEIPVRMPKFQEAVANFGRVEDKPAKEQLIIPEETFRPLDKLEITLASSAMVGVKRNFDILQEYRYDCLEQRISKQFPLLSAGDFLITYGLLDTTKEEISQRVETLLKLIPQYQSGSGGFKYYPDSLYPSSYLTCYVVEFVLEAKKQGYQIDTGILTKAESFLKFVANRKIDSKYPYSKNVSYLVQAYAVNVLAMDNILMKDALNNLFEVRDRIPFSGLAYLVKALEVKNDLPAHMQPVLAKTMLNKMKDAPTMTHFENHEGDSWWWVHESNVKTTSIVLEALLKVYKKFPYAEKIARWLSQSTRQKRAMSTQEHIRLFMAFEAYYRVFEKETPDFVANVLFNNKPKIKEIFKGRDLSAKTHNLSLEEFQPKSKLNLSFSREGQGPLYYLLRVKYYPLGEVESLDRGFKVEKIYKELNGKTIRNNTFEPGKKYIVELKVTTNQERAFVVLDDPVPAGFNVLNPRFKTNKQLDMEKTTKDNKWGGYWGNFYRSEYYFDRVEVFADYLTRGTHTWSYLIIATNEGNYSGPNTVCSEMYSPEVFGRSDNRKITIKE